MTKAEPQVNCSLLRVTEDGTVKWEPLRFCCVSLARCSLVEPAGTTPNVSATSDVFIPVYTSLLGLSKLDNRCPLTLKSLFPKRPFFYMSYPPVFLAPLTLLR